MVYDIICGVAAVREENISFNYRFQILFTKHGPPCDD